MGDHVGDARDTLDRDVVLFEESQPSNNRITVKVLETLCYVHQ